MSQIFILGSSNAYGVGGRNGGWADIIKQKLHAIMYGDNGVGEKYEIYNFGKSGSTIDFVTKTFPQLLNDYGRGKKIISIVSVGGNNIKAENNPTNFVSTVEEYTKDMSDLLNLLKKLCTHVIVLGSSYYDETKTTQKLNPLTGGKSYFTNKRRLLFESELEKLCKDKAISFIKNSISEEEWKKKYIHVDGLHPGTLGHELIAENVLAQLQKIL